MAVEAEAYALAAVSQAPEPFRRMLSSIFGGRPGVMRSTDWATSQNGTPNMSVNVAAGSGLVLGSESSTQGGYFCQSLSVTNLAITAANATNPRRDLIVARIRDAQYATGPTSAFDLFVVTGTAAASPVDPTVPPNCLVIARVAVAALAGSVVNANITDLRSSYTGQSAAAGLGGVIVCTSATRPTVGLYEGLQAYETDTDRAIVYNGSAWVGQGAMAAPAPQFYLGAIVNGTATGPFSVFSTQNAILVAPYPLTMLVTYSGDMGSNGAPNAVHMQIQDQAGAAITHGGHQGTDFVAFANNVGSANKSLTIMGHRDYTAGQTCGFRVGYRVDTSNIYIQGTTTVQFFPKVS